MSSVKSPESSDYGRAVEEDVRLIAAQLGVADFVFTVAPLKKGSGVREIGDLLLVANGMGAILQVKSRLPGSRGEDGSAWLAKEGTRAIRQAKGTRRSVASCQEAGSKLLAIPVRASQWVREDQVAASLPLTMDVSSWPTVVVLDHPSVTGITPDPEEAFWITVDDWLWLNRALRSVTAVLFYIRRVLAAGPVLSVPLGHEAERFDQIVKADRAGADADDARSHPWLTWDSLADPDGAQLYRELLERVWPPDASRPEVPIEDVRRILEFLDALPPGAQVNIGRWILSKREALQDHDWASGAVHMNDDKHLLVFASARSNHYRNLEEFDAELASLASVRSREVQEQHGLVERVLAVGHLVSPEHIDYRYIFIEPPLKVPEQIYGSVLHAHGKLDLKSGHALPLEAGRNERCPCGSGKKFKYCDQARQ